jgi:hypothetical protein
MTTPKQILAKYSGKCSICLQRIAKGQPIIYWPVNKQANHVICAAPALNRMENDKMELMEYLINNRK